MPVQVVSVNASDFEGSAKVEAFQHAVAAICKLEFRPKNLGHFRSQTSVHVLPGLITARGQHSASDAIRTAQLAYETGDNVMIHIPRSGGYSMQQKGGESVECRPGTLYVDPNEIVGEVRFRADLTDAFYVSIPRETLQPVRAALGKALRKGHETSPHWRMFIRYAETLHEEAPHLSAKELLACINHVHDLALMAFGATGELAEIAAGRGLRAARLRAIVEDIELHLQTPDLSPSSVAARHNISERYLRGLLASKETTFSDYVAQRRLVLVHRMLRDPGSTHRTISEIAYVCGFGDLSWFNTLFRRRYGMSPSEVRAQH